MRAVPRAYRWRHFLLLGGAGTIGGGLAGMAGGLLYGFAGASQPLEPGMGAASVLLVLLCLTILVALIGAAGVAFGIAAAGFASGRGWASVAGGAGGGLIVGAVAKLLGLDAFNLLVGQSPGDITGAAEGALLGGAIGLGAWLGSRGATVPSLGRGVAAASLAGGGAGILIPLLGGRLMGGSLDLLARVFPGSRLRFGPDWQPVRRERLRAGQPDRHGRPGRRLVRRLHRRRDDPGAAEHGRERIAKAGDTPPDAISGRYFRRS